MRGDGMRARLVRMFRAKRLRYMEVFGASDLSRSPAQRRVLADLARYAGIGRSHFLRMGKPDALQLARLEGRREMVLLIQEALHLSEDKLAALANLEVDDG
jgi:hypothetical protein